MSFRQKKKPEELTAYAQMWRAEYDSIKDDPDFLEWVVKFMLDRDLRALPQEMLRRGRVPLNLGPPPKQKTADIHKDLARRKRIYDYLRHKRRWPEPEARRLAFRNVDEVMTDKIIANQQRQVRERVKRERLERNRGRAS